MSSDVNTQGTTSITVSSKHVPLPAFPQNGTEIPQPFVLNWSFQWNEPRSVNDIEYYQLRVIGSDGPKPTIDTIAYENTFTISDECSHTPNEFISGWRWQIRSKLVDGSWSDWSKNSTFDVEYFDEPTFCIYYSYLCPDDR